MPVTVCRRQQPAQQQPPALEPDLVNMLDRMVSVYSRIESQEQQQQQQHQSSQRGRAGRQQQRAQAEEVIQLDGGLWHSVVSWQRIS